MICLYLVSRAREILTYHLRIDANRIVPAARRWRKAGKAAMYSVVPVTNNKGRCVSQITDGVSEDVREGKHFGLYSGGGSCYEKPFCTLFITGSIC